MRRRGRIVLPDGRTGYRIRQVSRSQEGRVSYAVGVPPDMAAMLIDDHDLVLVPEFTEEGILYRAEHPAPKEKPKPPKLQAPDWLHRNP